MNYNATPLTTLIGNTHLDHEISRALATLTHLQEYTDQLMVVSSNNKLKLILDEYGKIVLTSNFNIIIDKFKKQVHPVCTFVKESLEVLGRLGDNGSYFIPFLSRLLLAIRKIIRKGLSSKRVSVLLNKFICKYDMRNASSEEVPIYSYSVLGRYLSSKDLQKIMNEFLYAESLLEKTEGRIPVTLKLEGAGSSYFMKGLILETKCVGIVKEVTGPFSTLIYNCLLDISRTITKGTVLMTTAKDLLSFAKDEMASIIDFFDSIDPCVKVIFCSGNVHDLCLDVLNKKEICVISVRSKNDIRRIRDLAGGHLIPTLSTVNKESMGQLEKIESVIEGGKTLVKVKPVENPVGYKTKDVNTLVIKSCVSAVCDEQEREIVNYFKLIRNFSDGQNFKICDANKTLSDHLLELINKEEDDEMRVIMEIIVRVIEEIEGSPEAVNADDKKDVHEKDADKKNVHEKDADKKNVHEKDADKKDVHEKVDEKVETEEKMVDEKVTDEVIVDEETTKEEVIADGKVTDEVIVDEKVTNEKVTDEVIADEETIDEEEIINKEVIINEEITDEETINEETTGEEVTCEETIDEETIADEMETEEKRFLFEVRARSIELGLKIIMKSLEVDDFMMIKSEEMKVGPKPRRGHWDDN